MTMRTPLARVRGFGSARSGTEDFWRQRLTAIANAVLTLAGRNLHTWTKYSGLDPEVNAGAQSNYSTADFLTAPQVRYFTARIALGF